MKRLQANQRQSRNGFTVLELLIVMGLALFMATGTVIGFASIANKSKLGKARGVLNSALRQARAYATANSRDVIVVFAKDTQDELAHRGIGVFDPIENDYVTQWKVIPNGTGIQQVSNGAANIAATVPYNGSPSPRPHPWFWIKSSGTLGNDCMGNPATQITIRITEGPVINYNLDPSKVTGGAKKLDVVLNWADSSL